jgi:hypothetical protein
LNRHRFWQAAQKATAFVPGSDARSLVLGREFGGFEGEGLVFTGWHEISIGNHLPPGIRKVTVLSGCFDKAGAENRNSNYGKETSDQRRA